MKKSTFMLISMICLVMSSLCAITLTEGFEGLSVPPNGWTLSYSDPTPPNENLAVVTTTQAHEGIRSFRFSSYDTSSNGLYDQYLITPLLNTISTNTTFSFWYKPFSYGTETFKVGWSSSDSNIASFTWSEEVSASAFAPWAQYTKNDIPVGTHYLAIHYTSIYEYYLYVDEVVGPDLVIPDIDMKAVAVTGNQTPSVGNLTYHSVSVKNMGGLPVTNYIVKLMMAGSVELASIQGTPLASGQQASCEFAWYPSFPGPIDIYGKVVINGDANSTNDETGIYDITVQPSDIFALTLGSGASILDTVPLDLAYHNSITETIYLASELNAVGTLNGLSWYTNSAGVSFPDQHIKILIGETTQTNLSGGWIPSTALTQIFDGIVSFPNQENTTKVEFTTPYVYRGGNLIIMSIRPNNPVILNLSNIFFVTEGGAGRSREFHSDTIQPDPASPPTGNIITKYPFITFYFNNNNSYISGLVTSSGNPITGATIHFSNEIELFTNASGSYECSNLQPGDYSITAEKNGYFTQTHQVLISSGTPVIQDFVLEPLPLVTVTGHVVSSLAPTQGIEGAAITFAGTQTYSVTSNENGDFIIQGVIPGQTYNYSISATGFQTAMGIIAVDSTDVNMGTILLNAALNPPTNVLAAITGSNVVLTWDEPVTSQNVTFKVYRLQAGQENSPSDWMFLANITTDDLSYTDASWSTLTPGEYIWAVKAVYVGGLLSEPAFSNHLLANSHILTGTVTSAVEGNPFVPGAIVQVGETSVTANASGVYTMILPAGIYSAYCHANGYYSSVPMNVDIDSNSISTTMNFRLGYCNILFSDCFETYPDFSTKFSPWTTADLDSANTYTIPFVYWPGTGEPQGFMIFNPSTTTPPLTGADAHIGIKYAACFADSLQLMDLPNNDWMIMPKLHLGNQCYLRFWAKSYTAQYGLERFNVGISTTGNQPLDFSFISGPLYASPPTTWQEYVYDLDAYGNQDVYIGIKCLSPSAYILFIDDVLVYTTDANEDPSNTPVATKLDGNFPNPFNPSTTIKYTVNRTAPVSITIYNLKGQKVKTLLNEVVPIGDHSVSWNGADDNNKAVSSGIYFYKMKAGTYSSTKKMILMK